jgi:hypothetical protein
LLTRRQTEGNWWNGWTWETTNAAAAAATAGHHMRNVHARDFLCCFCSVVSTLCSTRFAWLLLRLGTAVYYVAACPVSNRRISFAYIIRRERSPLSLAMTSSLIVNGGKMRVESSQIVGVLWIISVVVVVSPYSCAPIFTRLSFVSHHLQPFWFLGIWTSTSSWQSHTHTRKGGFNTWMTHAPKTERYIHCLAAITKLLSIVSVLCYKQLCDWDGKQMLTGDFVRGALCVCVLLRHWNSHWATRFVRVQLVRQSASCIVYKVCESAIIPWQQLCTCIEKLLQYHDL